MGYKNSWQREVGRLKDSPKRVLSEDESEDDGLKDTRASPPRRVVPEEQTANLGEAERKKKEIRDGKRKTGEGPSSQRKRLRSIVIGGRQERREPSGEEKEKPETITVEGSDPPTQAPKATP